MRDAGLPSTSEAFCKQKLDLGSMDRTFKLLVEPPVGQQLAGPFHVTSTVSWLWKAVHAARAATTEEDFLAEVLGEADGHHIESERPYLRIDLDLHASVMFGKSLPVPAAKTWAMWSKEAMTRLENVEPLITEGARETPNGRLAILAWQSDPKIELVCKPGGELGLNAVSVHAFQLLELPRRWDDPEREADDHPHEQLTAMFRRLKAAMYAWGEVMDHLL